MSEKPFRVLGIQQIAIGGGDKQRLKDAVGRHARPAGQEHLRQRARERRRGHLRAGAGVHAVEVDLMQPLDPTRKPAVHQTPLNHVGLWVDDLPSAVEWMSAQGVRFAPGGIRKGAAGHDICFIHPTGNEEFPHRRRGRADRTGAGAARGGGCAGLIAIGRPRFTRFSAAALPATRWSAYAAGPAGVAPDFACASRASNRSMSAVSRPASRRTTSKPKSGFWW
jgi:lactoylglutathione lyase